MTQETAVKTSKVYLTNFSGDNYDAAKQYGELVPITFGFTKIDNIDNLNLMIAQKIIDSDREDWLCISGMALLCTICVTVWFHMHGQVKLLLWKRKGMKQTDQDEFKVKGEYRELILNNENITEMLDEINRTFK